VKVTTGDAAKQILATNYYINWNYLDVNDRGQVIAADEERRDDCLN